VNSLEPFGAAFSSSEDDHSRRQDDLEGRPDPPSVLTHAASLAPSTQVALLPQHSTPEVIMGDATAYHKRDAGDDNTANIKRTKRTARPIHSGFYTLTAPPPLFLQPASSSTVIVRGSDLCVPDEIDDGSISNMLINSDEDDL
jgi:flagellar hook-length control protein FliK